MDSVEREVLLRRPPEDVWMAVTSPAQMGSWFGAEVAIEPTPGGRATFVYPDGCERRAVVEVVDPPRELVFRWLPFERGPAGEVVRRAGSRVRLVLEPHPEGTRLVVSEELVGAGGIEARRVGFRVEARA